MDIYGLVRGPLVLVAFIVFILGLIYQAQQFFSATREQKVARPPAALLGGVEFPQKLSLADISNSFFGVHPVIAVITTIFHVFLIVVPIFILGHNVLLEESFGFSLFVFPEMAADISTLIVISGGVFFFLRRIFMRRVRAITTLYDYIIVAIVVAPFVTGYMATQQWLSYENILIFHILAGELMLMAIPFTKLKHGLLFFLYRYQINYEHCLGSGSRVWSYNQAK
ncbi:MAG: hypothetical protein JXR89_07315 [Deltaproteobacteria bacterium]|nr:hypothetical protein [Deltaproteobacteria bacterium]